MIKDLKTDISDGEQVTDYQDGTYGEDVTGNYAVTLQVEPFSVPGVEEATTQQGIAEAITAYFKDSPLEVRAYIGEVE